MMQWGEELFASYRSRGLKQQRDGMRCGGEHVWDEKGHGAGGTAVNNSPVVG